MSLFLPECNINTLTKDGKFILTGKDTKGLMSSKHDFAFKCGNAAEGQKWYDAISQYCANGTKSVEVSPAATSPAASVAPSVVTAASPAASVAATPVATPAVEQAPPAYEMHAPSAAK
jgi:hypothetical protein